MLHQLIVIPYRSSCHPSTNADAWGEYETEAWKVYISRSSQAMTLPCICKMQDGNSTTIGLYFSSFILSFVALFKKQPRGRDKLLIAYLSPSNLNHSRRILHTSKKKAQASSRILFFMCCEDSGRMPWSSAVCEGWKCSLQCLYSCLFFDDSPYKV